MFSMFCTVDETKQRNKEEFRLPVSYLDENVRHDIPPTVSSDLELTERQDQTSSVYQTLFTPNHSLGKRNIQLWNKQFTSFIPFLRDSQTILLQEQNYQDHNVERIDRILQHWSNLTDDNSDILSKYGYMEWTWFQQLNESPVYLQTISMSQLISPALTLLLPIIILFFPFVLLKMKGIDISVETYVQTLKWVAQNHFFGKLLNVASAEFSMHNLIYAILTTCMFFYSLYSNVILCQHFYHNMKQLNNDLVDLQMYLQTTIDNMNSFVDNNTDKTTFREFNQTTLKHCRRLREFAATLTPLKEFSVSIEKLMSLGTMLKIYYQIYNNRELQESIEYSFGFEGYLDNLRGVKQQLAAKRIVAAEFCETSNNSVFRDQSYPLIPDGTIAVKNTVNMKKNIILTGPNASGKTTILKTTLINIVVSQQVGAGFYTSARFRPYTHVHSYLNIPDSSGRDSLFQAESRRCKEILEQVEQGEPNHHHFCIFDELYSGTNYKEATQAAISFLNYMTKFKHVDFILTTHYRKICKKSPRIDNYKMDVIEHCNDTEPKVKHLEYTFKMKRGISRVEGGIQILREMNYPDEILRSIQ